MANSNNTNISVKTQDMDTANAVAVANQSVDVSKAVSVVEADVEVPSPKVVSHLQEMVDQHAAIREARMKKQAQANRATQSVAEQIPQQETKAVSMNDEIVADAGSNAEQGNEVARESVAEEPTVESTQETENKSQNQPTHGPRAKKTIDKLTARAKTAEEAAIDRDRQINELRAEVERLKKTTNVPVREVSEEEVKQWGEYARETDVNKLQTELRKMRGFRDEIQDSLDIGQVKTDNEGHEYLMEIGGQKLGKAQLVALKRDLNKRIEEAIPSRLNAIKEVQSYKQQADSFIPQWVPEAVDNSSDIYQELQAIKQSRFGWVLNEAPQAELYIALGIKAAKEQLQRGSQVQVDPSIKKVVSEKPIKPQPRANIQTNAGPSINGGDVSLEKIQEYNRLKKKAFITQNESDMAAAMSFKKQYNIK